MGVTEDYRAGLPIREIAKRNHIHTDKMYIILEATGTPMRRAQDKERARAWRARRDAGEKVREIAASEGVTYQAIYQATAPFAPPAAVKKRILALHRRGWGARSVARRVGYGLAWVEEVVRAHTLHPE